MAWNAPMTWTASAPTPAQMNNQVRDNLLETAVAKAANPGEYFVASGVNQLVARRVGSSIVNTVATTNVGEWTNVSSSPGVVSMGPEVDATYSGYALVGLSAYLDNNSASSTSFMSYRMESGGTVVTEASEVRALRVANGATGQTVVQASSIQPHVGATAPAGSYTFLCKYKALGGTLRTDARRLWVMGF